MPSRPDRQTPPWFARVYIAVISIGGALVLGMRLLHVQFDHPAIFVALIALSLATATLKVHLPLPRAESTMSLSYAVDFVSLLLLGPDPTMVVAATSVFLQCRLNTRTETPAYRVIFSIASVVITVQAAGLVLQRFSGLVRPGAEGLGGFGLLLIGVATIYFLLNTGFVAVAIALTSQERIGTVWQTNFLWSAPGYFISAAVAGITSRFVGETWFWLTPLALVPIYLTYRSYKIYMGRIENEQRQVRDAANLHLATVEALARAIDARDQPSSTHLQRVQLYATSLARVTGLPDAEVQAVETAALLHDIGKLAVPEHILSKPGRLTEEEFQRVRVHPQVGADIIADVPFPSPVVPSILGHHERWDGKGYPQGLKGEDIPLGARILSVVDHFEAVTAERPYHRPLGVDEAIALIKDEAGRALDPQLVATFVDLLPSLLQEDAAAQWLVAAPAPRSIATSMRQVPAVGSASDVPQNAYEQIALAHREINALYEIAQAMSTGLGVADTMAIISAKLTKIIPWSGCTLFVYGRNTQTLRCHFASGQQAKPLLNAVLSVDAGLDGWVARNRRTLVNANPAITFEAAGVHDTSLKSALVCPLVSSDSLVGVLSLFHVDADRYTEEHRRLLERVAGQAGAVIHNSVVFEQTQEDALTDPLTGLPNRRSMAVHFGRELARAERAGAEFAVVVIDIDGLKQINDSYGHAVGDAMLRQVATTLSGLLRPYDLSVRYAGDEFVLILANCSREGAELRRAEVQQRISEVELRVRDDKVVHLGVSAGASVYPHDGTTYELLVAQADRRMYRDKAARTGRAAWAPPAAVPIISPPHEGKPPTVN